MVKRFAWIRNAPASGSRSAAFQAQSMGGFASGFRLRFDGPMGTKSRETIYGASLRASAELANEARKEADRLACEAWNQRMLGYKGPAQHRPLSAMRSMPVTAISRSGASAATPIRPSPSVLSGVRRQHRSTSWSATCAARTAHRFAAIPTSGAIWWHCDRPRFRRTTHRPIGGRANDEKRTPKLVLNCELQVISVAGAEVDPRLPFRSIPRLALEGFALTAR
jgi:hypothetical protein